MHSMNILDDIVSTLNMEPGMKDIRQGLFHTGVLTDRCGLAATLPRDALQQEHSSVREPGDLLEKSTSDLVRMAYSDIITEAAVGMATINSLLVEAHQILLKDSASSNRDNTEKIYLLFRDRISKALVSLTSPADIARWESEVLGNSRTAPATVGTLIDNIK
jgi:uncharacterized protein (DUF4213/DUF364 family)